ncbi:SipW-dependent-type signal peptide-containing protein [Patescibacteria group bacterium]
MKKILLSITVLALAAGVAILGSQAFFSDTEESTGNVFQAGAIDLQIDNDSWYYGPEGLVHREDLSWELDDLTDHLFFNYDDLKPSDWGEDTISIHVDSNDAYACAYIDITSNDDVSSTEPELETGDVQENPDDIWDGELAQELNFFFWLDDGDNVYEEGELPLMEGPASNGLETVLTYELENPQTADGSLVGGETYYIGKVWCYGALTVNGVPQDVSGPLERHSGIICEGDAVSNLSQSDNMMLDMSFYSIQARHNEEFTCPQYTGATMSTRNLENKDDQNAWQAILDDETWGNIVYSSNVGTFYGTVYGQGLMPNAKYQITLNSQPDTSCGFTATSLGGFGDNQFQSGFWDSAAPNLNSVCVTTDEGVYNMSLVDDHYTIMTDAAGKFNYSFNYDLPSGDYSDVKVLVKKMLDTNVSPWVDGTYGPQKNLFETATISFTVL